MKLKTQLAFERLETRLMLDAGALDPSFVDGGVVVTPIHSTQNSWDSPTAMSAQSDGKLVVLGLSQLTTSHDFKYGARPVITRLLTNGTQDESFGDAGLRALSGGDEFAVSGLLVQADDSILIAGYVYQPIGQRGFVTRLFKDGQVDEDFGQGGRVLLPGQNFGDLKLAAQSTGQIVVAAAANDLVRLFRLYENGLIDQQFGGNGLPSTELGIGRIAEVSLSIQADDRIVLGCTSATGEGATVAVTRLDRDGNFEASFGNAEPWHERIGTVPFTLPPAPVISSTPEGSIFVGFQRLDGASSSLRIAKLTKAGVLDRSFGNDGLKTFSATDSELYAAPGGIVMLPNSQIGIITAIIGLRNNSYARATAEFIRLSSNGTEISRSAANSSASDFTSTVKSLVVQPDGKIVGLYQFGHLHHTPDFAVARWNSTGELDRSYGVDGQALLNVVSGGARVETPLVTTLNSGSILVVGKLNDTARSIPFVKKFLADGDADASFGNDGAVTFEQFQDADNIKLLAIVANSSGQFVVVSNQDTRLILQAYNSDGSVRSSFGSNGIRTMPYGTDVERPLVLLRDDGSVTVVGETRSEFGVALKLIQVDGSGSTRAIRVLTNNAQFRALDLATVGDRIVLLTHNLLDSSYTLRSLNRDGTNDLEFGADGIVSLPAEDFVLPVTLHTDPLGQITVGYNALPSSGETILRRYDSRGNVVPTFGIDGLARLSTSFYNCTVRSMVSDLDGGLLVAVEKSDGLFYSSQLLRVLPDGTLDEAFGSGGFVSYARTGYDELPSDLAFEGDGILLVGVTDNLLGADLQIRKVKLDRPADLWRNATEPLNVSGDAAQAISPLDALLVINELNERGPHRIGFFGNNASRPTAFVDVNGDGEVTPLDALLVINWLNSRPTPSLLAIDSIGDGLSLSAASSGEENSIENGTRPKIGDFEQGFLAYQFEADALPSHRWNRRT